MVEMNMIEALNSALDDLMIRDENVLVFGEDVGYFGGVFRVTDGLQEKHGAHRVFDTPLAEGGIASMAMGMGLNGLRPVAEIQFADYIFPAYDQIVNEIAKIRHRSGAFLLPFRRRRSEHPRCGVHQRRPHHRRLRKRLLLQLSRR